MSGRSILIVEDDRLIALALEVYIRDLGHQLKGIVDNGPEAVEKAAEHPDLILMDIRLRGEMSGLEAARIIQKSLPTKILFITANPDLILPFIQDAWFHDCSILQKPVSAGILSNALTECFKSATE